MAKFPLGSIGAAATRRIACGGLTITAAAGWQNQEYAENQNERHLFQLQIFRFLKGDEHHEGNRNENLDPVL